MRHGRQEARVNHRVEVESTGEHVNRTVGRGCCVLTCPAEVLLSITEDATIS